MAAVLTTVHGAGRIAEVGNGSAGSRGNVGVTDLSRRSFRQSIHVRLILDGAPAQCHQPAQCGTHMSVDGLICLGPIVVVGFLELELHTQARKPHTAGEMNID